MQLAELESPSYAQPHLHTNTFAHATHSPTSSQSILYLAKVNRAGVYRCLPPRRRPRNFGCGKWSISTTSSARSTSASGSKSSVRTSPASFLRRRLASANAPHNHKMDEHSLITVTSETPKTSNQKTPKKNRCPLVVVLCGSIPQAGALAAIIVFSSISLASRLSLVRVVWPA